MTIRVANAPCSWGVVEGTGRPGQPTWRQVLDEIRQSGYWGTELGDRGFMPEDPPVLREELSKRGLAMIGAFVPVALSDPAARAAGLEFALRTARLLAAVAPEDRPFVILADDASAYPHREAFAGRITPEHDLAREGWKTLAAAVDHIAAAVQDETGLRLAFHHHSGTFVETPDEVERLLEMTSPDLVGLCYDTGHYVYGGGDAVDGLRRFRERVWHVHFKDCDPAVIARARSEGYGYFQALAAGIFCGLGEGDMPLGPLVEELRREGYDGWVVAENEAPPGRRAPLDYAIADRECLRGLGL